jgi:hypothetical protein
MSPKKNSARKGKSPSATAPKKPGKSVPSRVSAWQDDPGAPGGKTYKPIPAPAPDLGRSPYPLAVSGPAPAAKVYPKGTAGFRYWNAAAALRRGADLWGGVVPVGTGWQPGGTLRVTLDHGTDLNAYYDRKGLWFFHAAVSGTTIYSGESPDVLCHELGHAILDSVRPQLWDAMSAEVAAFHESFGDMSALLSALQIPSFRQAVLKETGGTLYHDSRLSRLAEQLGWAIRQQQSDAVDPDSLRNAVNSFFYRDPLTIRHSGPASQLTSEPHNFSRVFTAGFFEALSGMVATLARPATDAALATASRDAAFLLIDAVRAAPVAPAYYSQVASLMLAADHDHFAGRYTAALKSAFVRRGILSLGAAASLRPAAASAARRSVLSAGAPPAPAGLAPVSFDAEEFALGKGKLGVLAASASPLLRVRSAAPSSGAAAESSGEDVARAFLAYLFRRGRVNLGAHGDSEIRVEHASARKTHDLVPRNGTLALVRRTFDCGFDCF